MTLVRLLTETHMQTSGGWALHNTNKITNHLRWPTPLSKRNKIQINIGTLTSYRSLQIQKRIRSNTLPTEPNISQIYKTHKILEPETYSIHLQFYTNPFALPSVFTDHTHRGPEFPPNRRRNSHVILGDSLPPCSLCRVPSFPAVEPLLGWSLTSQLSRGVNLEQLLQVMGITGRLSA